MTGTKDPPELVAFLGIDLETKPGPYSIDINIIYEDGAGELLKKEILVYDKKFPEKSLWVDEKFVTPPPQAQERIRRETELLEEIYGIFTAHWLGEGAFIIPSDGEMQDNFGEKRIYNNMPRSPHSGVDISSPYGSPVRASNSGRIVLANELYFGGQTVIIDHGQGVFSIYCHFSKILKKRGISVEKGEIIGEIGATGRVTGPHLHWGIKVMGSRVDPMSLLILSSE